MCTSAGIEASAIPAKHRTNRDSSAVAQSETAAFRGWQTTAWSPGAGRLRERNPMIMSGSLLIERDAVRPPCLEVEPGSHPNGWIFIRQTQTPQRLENELLATGWTFFLTAGPIRETALGFNRQKTVQAALNRCIQAVIQHGSNCLQIESVEMHSFLGVQ